ncbi:MAG TPA: uroporphyrinogen-III synthase, partial [Thermoanaerobaculia bacterium]|nr:uroporphyrinogen-III synthase [Thermoanaerobaculia bacterium]
VELVERSSHTIVPVAVPAASLSHRSDLVIFTSQVAVERVLADASLAEAIRGAVKSGRVAAVGEATAAALERHGMPASLVAGGSAESILERLPRRLDGLAVLLPCGDDGAIEMDEALRSRGAHVERVVVYKKVPVPADRELSDEIERAPFAAFCTTSPSAARWLFRSASDAAAARLRATPAVVLGRFTRRYLESHGVERIEVSDAPRFDAAARLLERLATGAADQ